MQCWYVWQYNQFNIDIGIERIASEQEWKKNNQKTSIAFDQKGNGIIIETFS